MVTKYLKKFRRKKEVALCVFVCFLRVCVGIQTRVCVRTSYLNEHCSLYSLYLLNEFSLKLFVLFLPKVGKRENNECLFIISKREILIWKLQKQNCFRLNWIFCLQRKFLSIKWCLELSESEIVSNCVVLCCTAYLFLNKLLGRHCIQVSVCFFIAVIKQWCSKT